MYSLARVYVSQRRYGDAENLLVRVLAARGQIIGLSHPYTQNTVKTLASIYRILARMLDLRILPAGPVCYAFIFLLLDVLTLSLQGFQRNVAQSKNPVTFNTR
jgi:hypothetical protein